MYLTHLMLGDSKVCFIYINGFCWPREADNLCPDDSIVAAASFQAEMAHSQFVLNSSE